MASNELSFGYLELADGSYVEVVDPYASPLAVRIDISLQRHREVVSFMAGANRNYELHKLELRRAIDHSLRAEIGPTNSEVTGQYYSETTYGETYVGTVTHFGAVLKVFGWDK